MNQRLRFLITGILFATLITISLNSLALPATAQQEPTPTTTPIGFEDGWLPPHNLSRSGANSEPQMVRDSEGVLHVIWRDTTGGFVYTRQQAREWLPPQPVELPFGTRRFFPDLRAESPTPLFTPLLLADGNGRLHALWIDDEATLYYSSVAAADFADYAAWTPRQTVANSARQMSAMMDTNGRLHLSYLRPTPGADAPVGIYYQQLAPEAAAWSAPQPQYLSPYLRTLKADAVNIHLFAADDETLLTVWDDNLLEQVFAMRSEDGGQSWQEPIVIDSRQPEDVADAPGPGQIAIGSRGDELLLTWRAGHEHGEEEEGSCTQYISRSSDQGATWEPRQLLDLLPGCLAAPQLISGKQQVALLGTIETTTYLLVWDGDRWSNPQPQELLTNFMNPETNQLVQYACRQTAVNATQLLVLGCDAGQAGDIWLTERTLGAEANWFPTPTPTPVWQAAEAIATLETAVTSLRLVADSSGAAHALWTQASDNRIWYARWDGTRWSGATPILTSPSGQANGVDVVVGNGRLLAVWQEPGTGIYYSEAATERANAASEWSAPRLLPAPRPAVGLPTLLLDHQANLFVAYTIPLNEQRGLYLIRSNDLGATWSEPIQVFDGVAAQWEMVAEPQLAVTLNGDLHLQWTQRNAAGTTPLALAYSRSSDLGTSWLPHEIQTEETVVWSDIVGIGEWVLHRVWLVENNGRRTLQHAWSQDSGQTWSRAAQVGGLGGEVETAVLTVDVANQPHVLAVNEGTLQHWLWQDERWLAEAGMEMEGVGALTAVVALPNQLLTVYESLLPDAAQADAAPQPNLFFAQRMLALPSALPTPLPTLTPTPQPTGAATATPALAATPTISFPVAAPTSNAPLPGLPETNNSWIRLAMGIVPAGLVVVVAFFVGVRAVRMNRG